MSESFWELYERSSLTQREFCAQHRISVSTLQYWRRKAEQLKPSAFVPVRVMEPEAPQPQSTVKVELIVGEGQLVLSECSARFIASLVLELRRVC